MFIIWPNVNILRSSFVQISLLIYINLWNNNWGSYTVTGGYFSGTHFFQLFFYQKLQIWQPLTVKKELWQSKPAIRVQFVISDWVGKIHPPPLYDIELKFENNGGVLPSGSLKKGALKKWPSVTAYDPQFCFQKLLDIY